MKTHYYLGWFNNFFPEKLGNLLQKDIRTRKSLVMISSNPSSSEEIGATERSWFDQADILFDEYYLINYKVQKEDASLLIQNASVIFLLGGNTVKLNEFLMEYELSDTIKKAKLLSWAQALVQSTCPLNGYARKTLAITLKKALFTKELVLMIFPSCHILILKII